MTKKEFTVAVATSPVCDFCSDVNVFSRYPAKDFNAGQYRGPDGGILNTCSKGDWAACKVCAALIEANKWNDLLDRSVRTFREKYGNDIPADLLRGFVSGLHAQFRQNRQQLQ